MFRLQRPHNAREHPVTTATATRNTGARQAADIQRLLSQLDTRGVNTADFRTGYNQLWTDGQFSERFASTTLRDLLRLLEAIDARKPEVPTGRYAVATDAGHYAFYRVWKGNRATLVFLQVSDDEQRLNRSAAAAILAKITAVGVLEASKTYGREIGVCGVCNRTLTNPESIANGIGPICAGRL
jgi:hypothetical protein